MGIQYKGNATVSPPTGVTLTTLYNDKVVDTFTKYVLDAGDAYSWTSQANTTAGATWLDLSPVGANATSTAAVMTFAGGGFVFDSTASQCWVLPSTGKPASTSQGYLATIWLKITAIGQGVTNVCGWHTSSASPWGMYANGGSTRQYVIQYDGAAATVTFPADGVYQVGMGRCSDDGGATFLRKLYVRSTTAAINTTSAASGATAQTSTPANASIGDDTGTGLGGNWLGTVYRHWMWDVGTTTGIATTARLTSLMDTDWNDNKARPFS